MEVGKKEGLKLVNISEAWVRLREGDNLTEGLCYILPAVVKTIELFHQPVACKEWGEEWVHPQC